jgi:pimeloyl-ACP methyl ester carboxylesterase
MSAYRESRVNVNGIDTAVFTAGEGDPLVFFHGGGTLTGFDSLLPLAEQFRLVVPHHPGFGASADDPSIDSIHDYVRHYLDLLDALELGEFTLVGHSMGAYLAATFAIEQTPRVRRLVLAAPVGLRVPEHPTVDLFSVRDEEVLGYLAADQSVFAGHVPKPPTPEFLADRYRESTSLARVFWNRIYDVKLPRWLHRLTMPTLLLWGEADRLVPIEQAEVWAELLPNTEVKRVPRAGHLLFDESADSVAAVRDFAAAEVAV